MRCIWKYILTIKNDGNIRHKLEVPRYAKCLSVGLQRDSIVIYYEVNPANTKDARWVSVYGTGQPLNSSGTYVGTVMMYFGTEYCGFHIYDEQD